MGFGGGRSQRIQETWRVACATRRRDTATTAPAGRSGVRGAMKQFMNAASALTTRPGERFHCRRKMPFPNDCCRVVANGRGNRVGRAAGFGAYPPFERQLTA